MSPRTGRLLHLLGMLFWGTQMVAVAFIMDGGWELYLVEISLAANFISNWAGWSAERPVELHED